MAIPTRNETVLQMSWAVWKLQFLERELNNHNFRKMTPMICTGERVVQGAAENA